MPFKECLDFNESLNQGFPWAMVFNMALRIRIQGGNTLRKELKLLQEVVTEVGCIVYGWCDDMVMSEYLCQDILRHFRSDELTLVRVGVVVVPKKVVKGVCKFASAEVMST